MNRAQVVRGGTWDVTLLEELLGVPPLDLEPVHSPVITIDGHIEADATAWLAYVHARTDGTQTAQSYASSLIQFVAFLLEMNTSLRGATRKHIIGYVRRRTVDPETRVSGNTWSRDRAAIKQFYEWLQETHRIAFPFTLDFLSTPHGMVSSMREGRNVPISSAAGTPLEPAQIPRLLAAAWRTQQDGTLNAKNQTGARDAAFISLGLACGARANTLAHLTVYELPDPASAGDLIEMRLPAATSKTRREVRLPTFRRHLKTVHDYARGARRMLLRDWEPDNPIRVAEIVSSGRTGVIDTDGKLRPFATMTADERRRLLTPEGEPAMLFLSARNGAPITLNTAKELTGDVSKIAEANASAHGSFFPHVHTHDLRHTYATHLAALFMLGVATGTNRDMHGRPHRVDVRSAVHMACTGLGHLNEATTALYIQQVGIMSLRYSVDDFLGRN